MSRHMITIAVLIIAILLYAFGFAMQATILIVLGCVAELIFWIRVIRAMWNTKSKSNSDNN
ncbi:MAG: hypothetical protein HKN88_05305 [Gammaproteobacteria bacterium]|nr:hypothetical protein [Gammaproteobacteria bacterium]NNM14885.1 hypothetical protein [Gammaproteobacteria bacterium]